MRTADGRRPLAAALLVGGLVVGGCSAPPPHPAAHPAPVAARSGDTSREAAVAGTELDRAQRVMSALRSYAFRTVATLAGATGAPPTVIVGRVVRPAGLAYTISSAGHSEHVVQLGTVGYVRVGNSAWRRGSAHPSDPLASLLAVLRGFRATSARLSQTGEVLVGRVPLRLVGRVPAGVNPAILVPATLVLDAAGHVTEASVQVLATAGTHTVRGQSTTTFTAFDAVAPVTAPR